MRYLIVNHVPLQAVGSGWQGGDLWIEDLRTQTRALQAQGFSVKLACPAMPEGRRHEGSGFHSVPISPAAEGLDYVPLPHYRNIREMITAAPQLYLRLRDAIGDSDIVQADYGGHPIALGQVAWPLAARAGKKRIWLFDGADPIPRMQLHADAAKNVSGRLLKRGYARSFQRFCRQAVAEADLVFAHNQAVKSRFAAAWGDHCHSFERSFVRTEDVLPLEGLQAKWQEHQGPRTLRLVVCGRLTAIKAIDQVIQAVALSRQQNAPVELLILGDGEEEPALRNLTARLGLDAVIQFHPAVPYGDRLFDALTDRDVMVVTNVTSEISRNIFLAMSRGLALLCYKNPATDSMLRAVGAARLVPAGSVESLAAGIQVLSSDRAQVQNMAARGLKAAAENTLKACHERRAALAATLLERSCPHIHSRSLSRSNPTKTFSSANR